MPLVLQITSGSRAGERVEFTKPAVVVGRHPESDLLFDAHRDLDVSTRHAEIRAGDRGWTLTDLGSTNGTIINGRAITAPHDLRPGDVVAFGAQGPRVEVVSVDGIVAAMPATAMRQSSSAPRPKTEERIAIAVAKQTGSLKKLVIGLVVVVVVGVSALVVMSQRQTTKQNEVIALLLSKNDSLTAIASGREAGLDSAARMLKLQSEAMAKALRAGAHVSQAEIESIQSRRRGVMSAAAVDYRAIAARNNAAVAFVAVEAANDTVYGGTAFGILPNGLLVTNKHVVMHEGREPKRVGIAFADTDAFLPVRIVSVVDDWDLAFLQIVPEGQYPVVQGIANNSTIAVGDPIAVIGFPFSTSLPMEGTAEKTIYRTTLTSGLLSKSLAKELQVDAFAAQGSSGSPLFDARGNVIGVVNSGNEESGGRVVFAVPGAQLIANLPAEAKGIVKP